MSNATDVAAVIESQLSQKSDAVGGVLLLKGDWGGGKTYLWKKVIAPKLREKVGKQIPILYVSCFGVSSVETLKSRIALEYLKEFAKIKYNDDLKKAAKEYSGTIGLQALKAGFEIFQKKSGLSAFPVKVDPTELIADEFIACIDDLERKSPQLSMQDILGVLSGLNEERKGRILIVANEDRIVGKGKDDDQTFMTAQDIKTYRAFREKVVSQTLTLKVDVGSIYDNFTTKFPESTKAYLATNKETILGLFTQSGHGNLRSLLQLMNRVHLLVTEKNIPLEVEYLKTLTAFVIEACSGSLSENAAFYNFNAVAINWAKQGTKDEQQAFLNKYFSSSYEYKFISELYDFVRNGSVDFNALKERLNPTPRTLNEAQQILQTFREGGLAFWSEAKVSEALAKAVEILEGNAELLAHEVVGFTAYISSYSKMLGFEATPKMKEKVTERLAARARAGDSSFSFDMRMHYASYSEHFQEFIPAYDELLGQANVATIEKQFADAVDGEDDVNFSKLLNQKNVNVSLFVRQVLDKKCIPLALAKPLWYQYILESVIRELEMCSSSIIPDREELIDLVSAHFGTVRNRQDSDRMVKFRLGILTGRLGRVRREKPEPAPAREPEPEPEENGD